MHDRRDCLGPGLGVQVRGMPAVAKVVSFFFSLWILCRLPAPHSSLTMHTHVYVGDMRVCLQPGQSKRRVGNARAYFLFLSRT